MATRAKEEREFDFSETDFANLVKIKSFVDKTWMIREIFNSSSRILITAPPRFGKSTNIDMIKRFLEIEVDLTQKTKFIHDTKNYKLFKGNNLNICRDKEFFQEHFGKHPVVYVDFEPLSDVRDFTELLDALRTVISKTFNQHSYLIHKETTISVSSDTANDTKNNVFSVSGHGKCVIESRKYFQRLISSQLIRDVNASNLMYSFQYLSRILYKHFDRKVFVLIDNYDAYVKSVLLRRDNSPDTEKIISFIKTTVSNLLGETTCVEQALLTGVIPVTDDGCHINGCYIDCYWFMGYHPFYEYFGLTSNELETVLNKFKLNADEIREKGFIEEWDTPYLSKDRSVKMYNIWSALQYIHKRKIENYYRYIQFYQPLFKNVLIRYRTSLLLLYDYIELNVPRSLTTTDILELNKIARSGEDEEDAYFSVADTLFLLLYHFGCFSIRNSFTNGFSSFQIVNHRIRYEMANAYLESASSHYKEIVYKIWSSINSFNLYDYDEEKTFETFCDCINAWYQKLPAGEQNIIGFLPSLLIVLLANPTFSNTGILEPRIILVNKYDVQITITAKEAAEGGMATMNAARSVYQNICYPYSGRFSKYVFISIGYRNGSDGVSTICSYKDREFSRYTHTFGFLRPKTLPYTKIFLVGLFIIIGARYFKT